MNNLQRLIFYLVRFLFAYCILLFLYRDHKKNKRFFNFNFFNNMAEDSKTYVFGQDCGMLSSLIPLMQKQGIDPNVLALINRDSFGGEGG